MRISDWSSDVCSSDRLSFDIDQGGKGVGVHQYSCRFGFNANDQRIVRRACMRIGIITNCCHRTGNHFPLSFYFEMYHRRFVSGNVQEKALPAGSPAAHYLGPSTQLRSEEHTSALQSLMRLSYAVFFLYKNNTHINNIRTSN